VLHEILCVVVLSGVLHERRVLMIICLGYCGLVSVTKIFVHFDTACLSNVIY
jgi:hypothetical protein